MKLYKFLAGGRVAFTRDSTGANLPADYSWRAKGELEIAEDDGPQLGLSFTAIAAGLSRDGYIIWPSKKGSG